MKQTDCNTQVTFNNYLALTSESCHYLFTLFKQQNEDAFLRVFIFDTRKRKTPVEQYGEVDCFPECRYPFYATRPQPTTPPTDV
jgi:hypothetical protein